MRKNAIERELKGQVMLNVTYNREDWKQSQMQALPRDRKLFVNERPSTIRESSQDLPTVRDHPSSEKLEASPVKSENGSKKVPILRKSQRVFEEEKVDGSVDAWKLSKDPRKANANLRRELAHVSRLRDLYKLHGKDESIWEFERKTFPGAANYIKELHFGPVEPPSEEEIGAAAAVRSAAARVQTSDKSRVRTAITTPAASRRGPPSELPASITSFRQAPESLPAAQGDAASRGRSAKSARATTSKSTRADTSKSARADTAAQSRPCTIKSRSTRAGEAAAGGDFRAEAATPGPLLGPETMRMLMGTHSRPTTMRRTIERRQPKAELHLLWNSSQRRGEGSEEEEEAAREPQRDAEAEGRRARDRQQRKLVKTMRRQIQARMTDTANLPRNLWRYFKDADADGSGRIEYPEYVKVMGQMGLGTEQLGETNLGTLFRLADKDRNGNIDFNEFLRTVVGNVVSL